MNKEKSEKNNIRKIFLIVSWLVVLGLIAFSVLIMFKEKTKKIEGENNNIDENTTISDSKNEENIVKDNTEENNGVVSENNNESENSEVIEEKMTIKVAKLVNNKIIFETYKVPKNSKILNVTLEKLFSLRSNNGKWNGLSFDEATLENKKATIKLSGNYSGNLDKMKKEIEASALRFSTIDGVEIFVGNNSIFKTNNSENSTSGQVQTQSSWTPCDGLFNYTGNQGNSTFIDTVMDISVNNGENPVHIYDGYEIRGCIGHNGSYGNWAPFEGVIGSYIIRDYNGNSIANGILSAQLSPGSNSADYMDAVMNGEYLFFRDVIDFSGINFSNYIGQVGTIEIDNDNASGSAPGLKTFNIIFDTI